MESYTFHHKSYHIPTPKSHPSCSGRNREDVYAYDWLDCKLKADDDACGRVTMCNEPGLTAAECRYNASVTG